MSKVKNLEIDPLYWKLQIGSKVENLTHPDYFNHTTQRKYLSDPDFHSIYFSDKTLGDTDPVDLTLFGDCYNLKYSDWLDHKYFGPEHTLINPGTSIRCNAYYKGQRQAQSDYSRSLTYSHPIHIPESHPLENFTQAPPPIPRLITFVNPRYSIIDI